MILDLKTGRVWEGEDFFDGDPDLEIEIERQEKKCEGVWQSHIREKDHGRVDELGRTKYYPFYVDEYNKLQGLREKQKQQRWFDGH